MFTIKQRYRIIAAVMSDVVNQSLRKIAGGAVLVFIGAGTSTILGLVIRVIITKNFTQAEYGTYFLAVTIINLVVLLSSLGLHLGSPRQVAFYRGKGDEERVRKIVLSSLGVATLVSLFFSVILFLASDIISTELFHSEELVLILKIFSISIPFFVFIYVLAAVFTGFETIKPSVYFQNILQYPLLILLLILVIVFNLRFIGVAYAFVVSIVLTALAFFVYTVRKPPIDLKWKWQHHTGTVAKELLLFSLPLFVLEVTDNVLLWTDTVFLGFFKTAEDVGLYQSALPLARFILLALSVMYFIYVPLMSKLYARNQVEEIRRSYMVIAKWIFAAAFPLFLLLILFPDAILSSLFGAGYSSSATALQILSFGFFFYVIWGPLVETLVAIGETRFLMWSGVAVLITNIVLNVVLIQLFGIIGAAIATSASRVLLTIIWAIRFYSLFRVQPFTINYIKPAVLSIAIAIGISLLVNHFLGTVPLWLLVIFLFAFLGIHLLSILVTRSVDKEDAMMFSAVEERFGLNLGWVRNILKRFS